MTLRTALLTILVLTAGQAGIASAQEGMGTGVVSPDARFVHAPGLGERIPDLTIVDDQGNPANIRELAQRSRYTVLTLGCLT